MAEAPTRGMPETGMPLSGLPGVELIQGKERGVILSPRISNLKIFTPPFKAAIRDCPCGFCLPLSLEIKLHLHPGQLDHIMIIQPMRLVAQ